MGFEGTKERVTHRRRVALRHARANSTSLGAGPAERWSHERFELPYLRDSLLDHGILVDTVETASRWSDLLSVYDHAKKALQEALWKDGTAGLVLCHVSHAYPDGASLYYTFLAPQREGREIEQWEGIKAAVTEAVLDAGAALSHHHGIGEDHAPYLSRVIGEDGLLVLRALKRELDPDGIMNPGTLVTGST
jgi:alkyldihydroxyacetonephosphate synthase